jgi:opacity protein-like surface antigen
MSGRQLWTAVLFVLTLATLLVAQDEKNEVGGGMGRTFISTQPIQGATYFDANIRYGRGIDGEGNYARRLLITPVVAIAAEVPLVINFDEDLHVGVPGQVPTDLRQLIVTPSLRFNLFPSTAVSPWGSVGGGFDHTFEVSNLIYGGTNPGKGTTSGVVQYGAGLDVKLTKRIVLRLEGRDFWAGEPDFPQAPTGKTRQNNYYVGIGAFWHF